MFKNLFKNIKEKWLPLMGKALLVFAEKALVNFAKQCVSEYQKNKKVDLSKAGVRSKIQQIKF